MLQLTVDLAQLPLEKAATLLELLAPFKVQMGVIRPNQTELSVTAEVEAVAEEKVEEVTEEVRQDKKEEEKVITSVDQSLCFCLQNILFVVSGAASGRILPGERPSSPLRLSSSFSII